MHNNGISTSSITSKSEDTITGAAGTKITIVHVDGIHTQGRNVKCLYPNDRFPINIIPSLYPVTQKCCAITISESHFLTSRLRLGEIKIGAVQPNPNLIIRQAV